METTAMETSTPTTPEPADEDVEFLASVEGEIAFFRAIMRARPIGMHRHFHVLNIRNGILRDTGHAVTIDSIWAKLRDLYDMDALEAIDNETSGYAARQRAAMAENVDGLDDFSIPYDPRIDELISQRRMRDTPSPVSPTPSPKPTTAPAPGRRGRPKKRGKSKLDMAGLVGGDSDSSALTQDSGDEGANSPTPRDSVTATEGGTEYGDDDVEMRDASPESTSAGRGRKKPGRGKIGRPRGGGPGRGRKKQQKK
ncbi:hypothetical protein MKEN_00901300 [Mycena kentingensis (nom. inval.)]|nr:hypothetical protein MKEN_00901300 [Mycena kentingensis (nom. inval.)]